MEKITKSKFAPTPHKIRVFKSIATTSSFFQNDQMATHSMPTRPRAAVSRSYYRKLNNPFSLFTKERLWHSKQTQKCHRRSLSISRIQASEATNGGGGDSYLDMWKKVVDNERMSVEFQKIANNSAKANENDEEGKEESEEELERRNNEFNKLLEVSIEERDRVQRMQVIDRAAAAIAAAKALLKENLLPEKEVSGELLPEGGADMGDQQEENQNGGSFLSPSGDSGMGTPGPNFWAWTPPDDDSSFGNGEMKPAGKASPDPSQSSLVMEKERYVDFLSIPFETTMLHSKQNPLLPPLQSLEEVEEMEIISSTREATHLVEEREIGVEFSALSAEASHALCKMDEVMTQGINPDGSRWWKEMGIEKRPDGVVCKWTLLRGVSVDKTVEWENKYWEAADEFGYKELASEKSGRDAAGNVWREYWRESMSQIEGLVHLEKTADKWGKNKQGDEWQEQWWEHYGASGKVDKWAHKWCSIDPNTPLEDGHAHVWHERWGEKYDGQGGSTKYTDKWAERFQGDGWDKWGDKWDEHFDLNGHGIKQGEKWWEGKHGDHWNRTWGEGHNGSGWVHKYGESSSGEHWDTHIQQDTWYEKFPHYGFYHCFENSVQLREVKKPSEWS